MIFRLAQDFCHICRNLSINIVEKCKASAIDGTLARRHFFHRLARLDKRQLVKARIIRRLAARLFPECTKIRLDSSPHL